MVGARHPVHYTFEEYLSLEETFPSKHEYLGGQTYAMAGGTPEHSSLAGEMAGAISPAIRSGPCRLHSSDLRIGVPATSLVTYPDLSVIGGPRELDSRDKNTVVNPTILVEVTSKSTEEYDRGEKYEHYCLLPSLKEYVLVSHRERAIEVRRRESNGQWSTTIARSGEQAELRSIRCHIDVDDIYNRASDPKE